MAENSLSCKNLETQEQVLIPVEKIVCILQKPDDQNAYRVLYLDNNTESGSDLEYLKSIPTDFVPSELLSQYLYTKTSHLSGQGTDIHIIISVLSGTGKANDVFENILQPLMSYIGLAEYKVHKTTSPYTITELVQSEFLPRAAAGKPQTLILLSGDGGLVDLINAFYGSEGTIPTPPSIALIPMGTGNAMANSTGLLNYPPSAFRALLKGRSAPIPPFSATFSPGARYITDEGRGRAVIGAKLKTYGAVVASWGIHAALVADSDTAEYRKFGVDRFKMAAQELLTPSDGSETHRYTGSITLFKSNKGEQYSETLEQKEHMYVLASLVSNLEKGFTISPKTSPLDGQLRLVHFGPVSPDEAMRLMGLAYQGGQHVHEETVTYADIDGLRIDFDESVEKWRRVCVDGKLVVVEQGGWMEIRIEPRRLINLICP